MEAPNILIVEDDPIIAADLQDRLEEMGYSILGPESIGEKAILYFEKATPPDLIIMDVQLDGEWDGIETAQRILEHHEVPVIFLTSNSDAITFNHAKKVKPQAFLSKPFRGRDLKHAIEIAITQASEKKQLPPETSAVKLSEENTFVLKDRLFIRVKDRMIRVYFKDILWVEADDYYCKLITSDKEYLISQTLKKFCEEFDGKPEFMRVHRSYFVNLTQVEEIGELALHIGKMRIPFSRSYKEELIGRLQKI